MERIRRFVKPPIAEMLVITFVAGLYLLPAGFELLQLIWLPFVTPAAVTMIVLGIILTIWVMWQIMQRLPRRFSWFAPDCPALTTHYARLMFTASMVGPLAGLIALTGPFVHLDPWLVGLAVWFLLVAFVVWVWTYRYYPVVTED